MPAIALVFVAAKATCFVLGSLIHEGKELMKHFGIDHDDTSKASCLLIKDEQLGLQETPKESPSNALILYASREIVLSSSSRALAILTNDDIAFETSFNVIENFSLLIMKSFNFSAAWAWFRARFIALIQSSVSLVIPDMKMAASPLIGSASERVVKKKAVASIELLIQANFSSRIMSRVLVILKDATRLLKSRYEMNMSTLLGQTFPAGFRGKEGCFDLLPDSTSVGDSITVDVGTYTQKYLAMVITCIRRVLAILSHYFTSLLHLRLRGLKVMTLVLLLFASMSFIGWSVPQMIFDGCKPEQGFLQEPLIIPEPVSGVEAGAFSSITHLFAYLSRGTSNFNMMDIGNFDDLHSSLMATGTNDGQVDLDQIGLAHFTSSLHLWQAKDFSTTPTPDLQMDCLLDDIAIAASLDYSIQSKSGHTAGCGTALESSLLMHMELVPSEDHTSNWIATEQFDGYNLSAIADKAFVLGFNSQASQDLSLKQLDLGYDRYSDLSGSRAHETHVGLDHPGLFLLSQNDFIAASSSHGQTRYFWNHKAAVALPLGWNIEVSHSILSESTAFICVLGDLWGDRLDTRYFALIVVKACDGYTATAIEDETLTFSSSFVSQASQNQSSVESLDRSFLSRRVSDGNTLSMQMIVAEVVAYDEISPIQCRDFDRSIASVEALIHPLLRLPSPKKFSAAATPSLRFGVLQGSKSLDIFRELLRLAWILLMLAYRNSDGATEEDDVLLSSESEMSTGTNLDLEVVCGDEMIFADEENGADEALLRNTNFKPSRYELTALHSELGRHWKSPSKRRMRRSSRFRSRPEYFEPTWA